MYIDQSVRQRIADIFPFLVKKTPDGQLLKDLFGDSTPSLHGIDDLPTGLRRPFLVSMGLLSPLFDANPDLTICGVGYVDGRISFVLHGHTLSDWENFHNTMGYINNCFCRYCGTPDDLAMYTASDGSNIVLCARCVYDEKPKRDVYMYREITNIGGFSMRTDFNPPNYIANAVINGQSLNDSEFFTMVCDTQEGIWPNYQIRQLKIDFSSKS